MSQGTLRPLMVPHGPSLDLVLKIGSLIPDISCFCYTCLGLSAPHCKDEDTDSSTAPDALPKDVRLPTDLHPTYYNLELKPDIYGDDPDKFQFEGYVEIFLNCTKSTSVIVVQVKDMTIPEHTIKVESVSPGHEAPKWTSTEEDKVRQFFKVNLDGPLTEGKQYVLKMRFMGPLSNSMEGIYWSSYEEGGEKK